MIETFDACNGCADCIGCGRKYDVRKAYVCDMCGDVISEYDGQPLGFAFNGKDLCEDCMKDITLYDENGEMKEDVFAAALAWMTDSTAEAMFIDDIEAIDIPASCLAEMCEWEWLAPIEDD